MTAAIHHNGLVVFFEGRKLYNGRDAVPDGEHLVPMGVASIKSPGEVVTILAIFRIAWIALAAADLLARNGISAEVVDVRRLVPLDAIVESVKKSSRAVVVDSCYRQFGVAGEIAASIGELVFDWLDARVIRIAGADVPIPFANSLKTTLLPDAAQVAAEVTAPGRSRNLKDVGHGP